LRPARDDLARAACDYVHELHDTLQRTYSRAAYSAHGDFRLLQRRAGQSSGQQHQFCGMRGFCLIFLEGC
jgi:hypothetical protein